MNQDKYRRHRAASSGAKITSPALIAAAVAALTAPASAAGLFDSFALIADTKTFFFQFVVAGGPIVWVVLLPMSVITGYLAIDLALSIRRKKLLPAGTADRIAAAAKNPGPAGLPAKLTDADNLLSCALSAAIARSKQANDNHLQLPRFAADALQVRGMHLLRKVEWCNIIGSVAPMVGLFGTVFGMIKAFNLLGISGGQPRPDQLAAAISIALITTFWGLLIAIPALAIAGIFHTRIQTILTEAAIELEALLPRINLQSGVQNQPAQVKPPQTKVPPAPSPAGPPPKKQPPPKVPIRVVPAVKQPANQVLQTKRPQSQPVQTQSEKPDGKPKFNDGSNRRFPAKPVS
jgi:biopolymer transport protein ExbB